MTDQPALFDAPPVVKLTTYQAAVLEHLTEQGTCNAATAGRVYHDHRPDHTCHDGCKLDRDGKSVLEALVKKGLAKRTRPGTGTTVYALVNTPGNIPHPDCAPGGPGELPDGF